MTRKQFEDMSNEELINENIKAMEQTEKLIKLTYIVLVFTIIADMVFILLKLGVLK